MDVSQRSIDDFSPRKQLEKLIQSCGEPDVVHRDDSDIHSNSTHVVIDRNDTLTKMLRKVDNFVAKYSGEDLRGSVECEIKQRYNAKIKNFVSRKIHASTRH